MAEPTLDDKLNLTINLNDVLDRLSQDERMRIIKSVGFESGFIRMVVQMMAAGTDEDGYWFGENETQQWRDLLVANVEGLQVETIKTLRNQRNQAIANEKRIDEWAWRMYHMRDDLSAQRIRWPEMPEYKHGEWTTREKAEKILKGEAQS